MTAVYNAIGLGCRLNIASGRKRVYILIAVVEKRQELENHETVWVFEVLLAGGMLQQMYYLTYNAVYIDLITTSGPLSKGWAVGSFKYHTSLEMQAVKTEFFKK